MVFEYKIRYILGSTFTLTYRNLKREPQTRNVLTSTLFCGVLRAQEEFGRAAIAHQHWVDGLVHLAKI